MNILITNDDGIEAKGIEALVNQFIDMGDVTVVAPNKQMSATSHAITTVVPVRVQQYYKHNKFFGYAVTGTPADCIKLAVSGLLSTKPDIVLSGVNHGRNTGINIMYSGTVAGAAEGFLFGIPSFAVSLSSHDPNSDCSAAAFYAYQIVREIMKREDKNKMFININVPALETDKIKGIKIVKSADSYWNDEFEKRVDPFGRPYYWFNGEYSYNTADHDTDDVVVDDGYVAVTPIQYKFTNLEQLESIKEIEDVINNNDVESETLQRSNEAIEKLLFDRNK